jgi:hypothetical protein
MPDLITRAQEAFLGAIISDPRQLTDLQALRPGEDLAALDTSEFTDPTCRALWAAIGRLSDLAPGASGPEMTGLILATTEDPQITRGYLTQLALSAPTPGAAAVYARMITEAALIRDLAAATGALSAGGASQAGDPSIAPLAGYAANLTAAWSGTAPGPAAPGAAPQDERAIAEERFLAGLAGHQALTGWITLDPAIFTAPGLREVYQALLAVDRAGEPADEMTLTWAAARMIGQRDTAAGRATTPQSLAGTIPPGTIARLTATHADPLTALQTGRDLLADHARAQIGAQAAAARAAQHDLTTGDSPAHAGSRGRELSNGTPPLLHPPPGQPMRHGPQLSQDGNG